MEQACSSDRQGEGGPGREALQRGGASGVQTMPCSSVPGVSAQTEPVTNAVLGEKKCSIVIANMFCSVWYYFLFFLSRCPGSQMQE